MGRPVPFLGLLVVDVGDESDQEYQGPNTREDGGRAALPAAFGVRGDGWACLGRG